MLRFWGPACGTVLVLIATACALGAPSPSAGADSLTLTVVYDNNPFDPQLMTGDGFAVVVEGLERRILFDTGADSSVLLENMNQLGIDPRQIDIVVLSHIHNDHAGGLFGLLDQMRGTQVYVHPLFAAQFKQRIRQVGAEAVEVRGPMEIVGGVFSTGELGDAFPEQALVLKTAAGLIVITGCAHPGLVTITAKAKAMLGGEIRLVMGGFHQYEMAAGEIGEIIGRLRTQGVKKVGPGHCSGDLSRRLFREEYRADFVEIGVGRILKLGNRTD